MISIHCLHVRDWFWRLKLARLLMLTSTALWLDSLVPAKVGANTCACCSGCHRANYKPMQRMLRLMRCNKIPMRNAGDLDVEPSR